jgi:hypothetical protein
MRLKPWRIEPENCHVLAIFKGQKEYFENFVQVWLRLHGDLELYAISIDPQKLPWGEKTKEARIIANVVSPMKRPAYHLIDWWQRRADWQLLYRALPVGKWENAIGPNGVLPGTYLPWGREADRDILDNGRIRLILNQDKALLLPKEKAFENLFNLYPPNHIFQIGCDGPQKSEKVKMETSEDVPSYVLTLSLIKKLAHQRPTNPEHEAKRLQHQINDLQERVDMLLWWGEQSEVEVRMYVYPEIDYLRSGGTGTAWKLRDWFVRAPDEAIGQFHHKRVVVDPLGPLHLVIPKDFRREPKASPPKALYELILDREWWKRGRQLFVPKNWELWPPPPSSNKHVAEMLEKCLWEKSDPAVDAIVLIRTVDKKEYRFAVNGFKPLENQMEALNIQIMFIHAERNQRKENNHPVEVITELLKRICEQTKDVIQSHANEMEKLLKDIWSGPRADLDSHRKKLRESLNLVEKNRNLRKELKKIDKNNYELWSMFRNEVLLLDREFLPINRNIKSKLSILDGLREELIRIGGNSTPEKRNNVVEKFHEFAKNIAGIDHEAKG